MIYQALKTLRTLLPNESVNIGEIEEQVDFILSNKLYQGVDRKSLIKEAEVYYRIKVEEYQVIEDSERNIPWLDSQRASVDWKLWPRYRDYLEYEKQFPLPVVGQLDRLSDDILDKLFNPKAKIQIGKRGLVVGQVQSGKTSNYTGLICKAADAGFNFIIVLAGMHNNLRSQTQLRLDEGFLGFDTQHHRVFEKGNKWVGVGKSFAYKNQEMIVHSMTSSHDKGDFNKKALDSSGFNFNTKDTIVAVVKKNSSVLRNLSIWLQSQIQTSGISDKKRIRSKALLLIDDEADNASINTGRGRVTAINGHIRNILNLFEKNAYVGYTATPFANVFVPVDEKENIFPRDFIINLPAPSNYIGPEKVFGFTPTDDDNDEENATLPIVFNIDDYRSFVPDKHKKKDAPTATDLPDSLKLAIKSFILTCTIRNMRGQNKVHNSMLIHVSRYTNWQNHIFNLVNDTFYSYRRRLEMKDPDMFQEFQKVFEGDIPGHKNYVQVSEEIASSELNNIDSQVQVHRWEDVKVRLFDAANKIKVKEINGSSHDSLDYADHPDGLSVIVIGGDKLSRGLTLEGLSVSYFLRASKMYDTLMQMGRWFGYRRGYMDLCRLFTTRELNEWFCHITSASEELREEFDCLSQQAGTTPEKYALKVRTHPGVLQITASNKLRSAVPLSLSFSGHLAETYEFDLVKNNIQSNFQATHQFIRQLGKISTEKKNAFIWKDVPVVTVLDFLQTYRSASNLRRMNTEIIAYYINKVLRNSNQTELIKWSVALMNKPDAEVYTVYEVNGKDSKIGNIDRKREDKISDDDIYYLSRSRLSSPAHEHIDLDATLVAQKLEEKRKKEPKRTYLSGKIIREELRSPQNPLLLLYSINPDCPESKNTLKDTPIIGIAVSFPRSELDIRLTYVDYLVQDQLLKYFFEDDFFEGEYDEE